MEGIEFYLQYKGLRTILGILFIGSGFGLFLELFLLEKLSKRYFLLGPVSKRKVFANYYPKELLEKKIGELSDRKIASSKIVGNHIFFKFVSSIRNIRKNEGILYTERLTLIVDEEDEAIICEVRKLYSSTIFPLLTVVILSESMFSSIAEVGFYEKIIGLSMTLLFGVFLFYYLRGRTDICDRIEEELLLENGAGS